MNVIAARAVPTPVEPASKTGGVGLTFGAFGLPECWLEMPDRFLPLLIHENLPEGVPPESVFELVTGIKTLLGARLILGVEVGAYLPDRRLAGEIRPAVRRFATMKANLPGAMFKDTDSLVLSFLFRTFWALEDEGHPLPP